MLVTSVLCAAEGSSTFRSVARFFERTRFFRQEIVAGRAAALQANYGIASDTMQHSEQMLAAMKAADEAGLQLITHAIGDRANHTILDFYERIEKETVHGTGACASSMRRGCCRTILRDLRSCM